MRSLVDERMHGCRPRLLCGDLTYVCVSVRTVVRIQALQCQLRECRCVQKAGWDRDTDMFGTVVDSVCRLADTYLKLGDAASRQSAADYLRPLVKRTAVRAVKSS